MADVVELEDVDFSKVVVKKEGGKLVGDWKCCKVYYGGKEGIPLKLRDMYVDFTGKGLATVVKRAPTPGIAEGFISFNIPARSEAWLAFLTKFNLLVVEKIPLSAIPADFKTKMDEEAALNYGGVRAYENDASIYKKLADGNTRKVPFGNYKSTYGNGDIVVRLHRIHYKNTEVKLKFRLHYAMIQSEAPLEPLVNPFMSPEEESTLPIEAKIIDE